jgi:hypothetical protein
MESTIEVPGQVRELAVTGIDNVEKALALFFDNVAKSIAPSSAESVALIRRVIAVKMDYARKIARATDLTEATALQFAYCRSQVEITADLIRIVSDHSNTLLTPRERTRCGFVCPSTSPPPPPRLPRWKRCRY